MYDQLASILNRSFLLCSRTTDDIASPSGIEMGRINAHLPGRTKADNPTHDTGIPALQREHNSYIMDHVLNSNQYTPAEIRCLNYCQLYLNVVTVLDLVKPDGITLDSSFMEGQMSAQSIRLAKYGVNQERPSQNEWRLWRRENLFGAPLAVNFVSLLENGSI